jgi:hypothetical protein
MKMAMLSVCGIDVSKDRLDVMMLPEQQCWSPSRHRRDGLGMTAMMEA